MLEKVRKHTYCLRKQIRTVLNMFREFLRIWEFGFWKFGFWEFGFCKCKIWVLGNATIFCSLIKNFRKKTNTFCFATFSGFVKKTSYRELCLYFSTFFDSSQKKMKIQNFKQKKSPFPKKKKNDADFFF